MLAGCAIPWSVSTRNSRVEPATASGHKTSISEPEIARTGAGTPFTHTFVPPREIDLPVLSDALSALLSQRPKTPAIAPGPQTASRDRLAALTTPVTTGTPASTCTVTEAFAAAPVASRAVKLISWAPTCVLSGVHQNSPASASK